MESLYRTYRPLTFDDVVGQQHIVSTLEHAVSEGRLSHAYLFCGPRGTGKTTMARILAKSLLCEHAAEARATGASGCMPDGSCIECREIAAGNHPDVYELDAASRTGVDNVREEIIGSVNYAPVRGAYKVYIIDEVHMLTTAAFNALLKTLEEPPAHVVFVMCTTDPQKIPETILSRCQRFEFHRIGNEDIVSRLVYICDQEGFTYDAEALQIVAKHARGGMRDALSTLEQLSVFGNGAITLDDARSLLGEVPGAILSEFAQGIAKRDAAGLFGLVRTQVDDGGDLMELARDLTAHIRDIYMVRVAGTGRDILDATPSEMAQIADEARLFDGTDQLARALTVLDDAVLEMRSAPDVRLVLEIALTRLARPESDLTLEALADRIDRLEAKLAGGVAVSPAPAQPAPENAPASSTSAQPAQQHRAAPKQQPMPAPAPVTVREEAPEAPRPQTQACTAPAASRPQARRTGTEAAPAPASSRQGAHAPKKATPYEVAAASAPETPAVTDPGDLQRKWTEVVKRVTKENPPRGGLLLNSRAISDDGDALRIGLPSKSNFAIKMLAREDSQAAINPIVIAVFGRRRIEYSMGGDPAPKQSSPVAASKQPEPSSAATPQKGPSPTAAQASASSAVEADAPEQAAAPGAPAPQAVPAPQDAPAPQTAPEPRVAAEAETEPATAPAPQAPSVDKTSGPTILPEPDIEADRRAWEDDAVPYEDDMVPYEDDPYAGSYEPPFDMPGEEPAAAPAAPTPAIPLAMSKAPSPARTSAPGPVSAAQAAAQIEGINYVQTDGIEDKRPETLEDAKDMLSSIFGNVIIKEE